MHIHRSATRTVGVITAFFPMVFAMLVVLVSSARAELKPTEVAILANQNSSTSVGLANYYANQRGIPTSQICSIPMPTDEVLSRSDWETLRRSIRRWIAENKLQRTVRCFVTTWDVPLKIGPVVDPDTDTRIRQQFLRMERERRVERLNEFLTRLDALGSTGAAIPEPELTAQASATEISKRFDTALGQASQRVQSMSDPQAKQAALQGIQQIAIATAGFSFVARNLQQSAQAADAAENAKLESRFVVGRVTGLNESMAAMDSLPPSAERDSGMLQLIERTNGILGTISWIDSQQEILDKNETNSSFDSELALVLMTDYPLLRWQPNYLNYRYDGSPMRTLNPTLMVSRLEAPTAELAKGLIDEAIRVEKAGLQGTAYFDARGITTLDETTQSQPGSMEAFDRSVLMAHKLVSEFTNIPATLENTDALFGPGECPDAALYAGWYSLAQYVDAFDWKPGAVGYHMASSEATTIRKPESQVWCKRMLEDGVAATLGPVDEPYLSAFPQPDDFYAALLCGKYTYVEAVYRTKPFNSWMMTVIGDPLYKPFGGQNMLNSTPAGYARVVGD